MGSARLSRFGRVCLLSVLALGVASAGNISYTGTFVMDDDHATLSFTIDAPSFVTIRTFGYGGGTNVSGAVIDPGGFDPFLSLFDSIGGLQASSLLLGQNGNAACGTPGVSPQTPLAADGGLCLDSYFSISTLAPNHSYSLVLTQEDNLPFGPTYGDGFVEDGNGNFTAGGCSGTNFCDQFGNSRNGNWAVDITMAPLDVTAAAPEPAPFVLLGTGFAGLLLLRRRRNHQRL
jgi:hypothetical protein